MSLGLPSSAKIIDKVSGLANAAWQGWFQKLDRALMIPDGLTTGDVIVYAGNNTGEGGGPPAVGTVTHTGALTDHQVVLGNGAADIQVLGSIGTAGQVLTSQGAGLDPVWAASSSAATDAETLAWLAL